MNNVVTLKQARDMLLRLHKSLVDFERSIYEGVHGPATSGQFLHVLLEDADFAWLRKFSTLIVDVDEMFAQKDGYSDESVTAHLETIHELIAMKEPDEDFIKRYRAALQQDLDAAARHGDLKKLLSVE